MPDYVQEIVSKHKADKSYIAILQSVQEKYGYLPEEPIKEIARQLGVPLGGLWGVATFYAQFKLKNRGKYLIQVCNGTACHVNHSRELIEFLTEHLQISPGETTKDNLYTFELVNCIGACARGPTVMINGTVYGKQTRETLKKIVDGLK